MIWQPDSLELDLELIFRAAVDRSLYMYTDHIFFLSTCIKCVDSMDLRKSRSA